MPEEPNEKDKAQNVIIREGDTPRLVHVARKTKIRPWSEGIVLVATDARRLLQIEPLLEWDSIQAWTTASGIINAIPTRPINVIVRKPKNVPFFLATNQRNATALSPPSAVVHNKYDELSPYSSNLSLCESVKLFHTLLHVNRLQKMINHERVIQKDETRLTEDC